MFVLLPISEYSFCAPLLRTHLTSSHLFHCKNLFFFSKPSSQSIKQKRGKSLDLRWVLVLFRFSIWVMAVCCDLEVDVNGEETFLVNKRIVCSYSGRLSKLFGKSASSKKNLKVIFNDFPGGAESFELVSRFCYNKGKICISPSNISLLHSTAKYMEMNSSVSGSYNLLEQTERLVGEIGYWSWPELMFALKHFQNLHPAATSEVILEKCLDSLVGKLTPTSEASPSASTSSLDSSGFRFSYDSKSTESLKYNSSRTNWWFDDLSVLSPALVQMVVKSMISRKHDHVIISRFLFHYQKLKSFTASSDEKQKILETVIEMLFTLDRSSISCKNLCRIVRAVLNLNVNRSSRKKLESMIGSQLDQLTVDNLLVPSPSGARYLYDVNLVLRLLKAFLQEGCGKISPLQSKKVAGLIDLYLAEVAPDPHLRPSKFLALALALPDSARDSSNELYHAMNIYLEVHVGLSEEEKVRICCALNYEKLSPEACLHLSQNAKFPSKNAAQALISQQFKLKSVVRSISNSKACIGDSPLNFNEKGGKGKKESGEQIVVYSGKVEFANDNEKLKAHLQGMQWRVMELEKVCQKMQSQMGKIMKSKVPNHSSPMSLPRLCS